MSDSYSDKAAIWGLNQQPGMDLSDLTHRQCLVKRGQRLWKENLSFLSAISTILIVGWSVFLM